MPNQPPMLLQMIPFFFLFGVLYFMIIRPQQNKQKKHRTFLEQLQKNQEIVTSGGIYGTVIQVKDKTVTLRIAEGTKIEIDKASISHAKTK